MKKRPLHVFNYSIRNQSSNEVDIHIDGDIVDADTQAIWKAWFGDDTSVSFKSFRDQINAVDAEVYNVYINSPGGVVTDAMAIHDLLKDLQAKGKTVNTKGRGLIGSAATYILMAGNNAEMSKNSWFMIHNVSGGVFGDVNEVERYASTLRKFNNASRDFYAEATGLRKEDITRMMNEETWMTATEAKQKGFIKQITGEVEFTQAIDRESWPFANTAVLNFYNSAVKQSQKPLDSINQKFDDMKKLFQDLAASIMNSIKGVKAPENNDHSALMNSIGEAVKSAFEAQADAFEQAVNDAVATGAKVDFSKDGDPKNALDAAVKNAVGGIDFAADGPVKTAVENLVKVAVENAAKDFEAKITALEKAKGDLEQEITNLKGKPSNAGGNEGEGKVRGGKFS